MLQSIPRIDIPDHQHAFQLQEFVWHFGPVEEMVSSDPFHSLTELMTFEPLHVLLPCVADKIMKIYLSLSSNIVDFFFFNTKVPFKYVFK